MPVTSVELHQSKHRWHWPACLINQTKPVPTPVLLEICLHWTQTFYLIWKISLFPLKEKFYVLFSRFSFLYGILSHHFRAVAWLFTRLFANPIAFGPSSSVSFWRLYHVYNCACTYILSLEFWLCLCCSLIHWQYRFYGIHFVSLCFSGTDWNDG